MTKGPAGTRWESVVAKLWTDLGGNQEETLPINKFGRSNTNLKERIKTRKKPALRKKVKTEKHLDIYGEVREGMGNNTFSHNSTDFTIDC